MPAGLLAVSHSSNLNNALWQLCCWLSALLSRWATRTSSKQKLANGEACRPRNSDCLLLKGTSADSPGWGFVNQKSAHHRKTVQSSNSKVAAVPRDRAIDSSLAFLREGYNFIGNRCRQYGSEIFETRLLLHKATCVLGAEAAEVFYAGDRFTRVGAMPITVLKLLQDFGSVELLDGEAHRHRKNMFLSIMTPRAVDEFIAQFAKEWEEKLPQWRSQRQIVLFDELREILCRTVCRWAGMPLTQTDVAQRTRELGEMIEATGSIGPRNWRAQVLRRRCEKWIEKRVTKIRAGQGICPGGSPCDVIAHHRGLDGDSLPTKVAAVELINILRPTVAVARYIVFAALALHLRPDARRRILLDDADYLDGFVQEVRRFYPFFPAIGGRVNRPFQWRGRQFKQGD